MDTWIGQGRWKGGKLLKEALLMSFEGVFCGVGGQVGGHQRIRQGAGRPSVVLRPERPTHFWHNDT